jgi:ethanolamine ammonia-lyase large subunit
MKKDKNKGDELFFDQAKHLCGCLTRSLLSQVSMGQQVAFAPSDDATQLQETSTQITSEPKIKINKILVSPSTSDILLTHSTLSFSQAAAN